MKLTTVAIALLAALGSAATDSNSTAEERTSSPEGCEEPDLFTETIPMIWVSRLVYSFSYIVREARKPDNALRLPDEITEKYINQRLDVRGLNDGKGLSFNQIYDQFIGQVDELERVKAVEPYDLKIIDRLKQIEDAGDDDHLYLEVFDSIGEKYECVYGIFRDEMRKRIVISFRGSHTKTDWKMNFKAQLEGMYTGDMSQKVMVHRGFYKYLFNNTKAKGEQRYDKILNDIKPFVEEGYKIYITGHSLGAALASMLAFKLAGAEKSWIPKPITCITLESPFVGGLSFRTAFQKLERDGLLRYLRITNSRDIVPAIPPFSLGLRNVGLFYHVGIRLDLFNRDKFVFSYPHAGFWNAFRRALGNSILKPFWSVLHYHDPQLVDERMHRHMDQLLNVTINEMYEDGSTVRSVAVPSS